MSGMYYSQFAIVAQKMIRSSDQILTSAKENRIWKTEVLEKEINRGINRGKSACMLNDAGSAQDIFISMVKDKASTIQVALPNYYYYYECSLFNVLSAFNVCKPPRITPRWDGWQRS